MVVMELKKGLMTTLLIRPATDLPINSIHEVLVGHRARHRTDMSGVEVTVEVNVIITVIIPPQWSKSFNF